MTQGLAAVDPLAQTQGAAALPAATDKTDQAARQFEGLLMGLLFQSMRKTVEPSGLLGDSGQSQSTYEYLMDQSVIEKAVSSGRGWGLAERLKADWARQADSTSGSSKVNGPQGSKAEKNVHEKDIPVG
jgi:Rod binding domain-containing protein